MNKSQEKDMRHQAHETRKLWAGGFEGVLPQSVESVASELRELRNKTRLHLGNKEVEDECLKQMRKIMDRLDPVTESPKVLSRAFSDLFSGVKADLIQGNYRRVNRWDIAPQNFTKSIRN